MLKLSFIEKLKLFVSRFYQCVKRNYLSLKRRQQYAFIAMSTIVILVLLFCFAGLFSKSSKPIKQIQFEHTVVAEKAMSKDVQIAAHQSSVITSTQLKQIEEQLSRNNKLSQTQAQRLYNVSESLRNLPSQQDLQTLTQALSAPNPTILSKVDTLQNTVQKIVKQTAKVQFINPKIIERYFQLVAIQGFSDGMRAIIEIADNQLALSPNEVCPACRGWVLKHMNFSDQTAIFEDEHHQFVKLQTN